MQLDQRASPAAPVPGLPPPRSACHISSSSHNSLWDTGNVTLRRVPTAHPDYEGKKKTK